MEESHNLRIENDVLRQELEVLRQQIAAKDSDYSDLVTQHEEALNLLSEYRHQLDNACSAADGCGADELADCIGRLSSENASILAENFEMSSNIYAMERKHEKLERTVDFLSASNRARQWQLVQELTQRVTDLESKLDMLRSGTMSLRELCLRPKYTQQTETKTTAEVFDEFSQRLREGAWSSAAGNMELNTLPIWAQERIAQLEQENSEMCQCVPKLIRENEEHVMQFADVMQALQGAYTQLDEARVQLQAMTEKYTEAKIEGSGYANIIEQHRKYVDLVERVLTAGNTIECTVALVLIRTYSGQQDGIPYHAGQEQPPNVQDAPQPTDHQKHADINSNESMPQDFDKNFSKFFEEKLTIRDDHKARDDDKEKRKNGNNKEEDQPTVDQAVEAEKPISAQQANAVDEKIIYGIRTDTLVYHVNESADNQNGPAAEEDEPQVPPAENVDGGDMDSTQSEASSFEIMGERSDESEASSTESWDDWHAGGDTD